MSICDGGDLGRNATGMVRLDPSALCEFLAYWAGGTTLSEVGRLLGYTSRRIQSLVEDGFKRRGAATAHYDPRLRQWTSEANSSALHGARSAQEAVTIMQALKLWSRGTETEQLFPVVDVRAYQRGPAPDTFRVLLGACMRRQVVDVVYLARTGELAVSFSPHTLVVGPHRSHFRGYSSFEFEGQNHYWDLVPSRVVSAEVRPALGYVDDRNDAEWHTEEVLRLRLKTDLPEPMRQAIRYEYDLLADHLAIGPVRKALSHYVRAAYLDRRFEGFAGSVWDADSSS